MKTYECEFKTRSGELGWTMYNWLVDNNVKFDVVQTDGRWFVFLIHAARHQASMVSRRLREAQA